MTRWAGVVNFERSVWTRWRWLTLSLMALWLTLVIISVIAVTSLADRMASIAHTHNVIAGLTSVQSRITDVETAQRGYVLTGRKDYLEPIVDAEDDLADLIGRVRVLTGDKPYPAGQSGQRGRVDLHPAGIEQGHHRCIRCQRH